MASKTALLIRDLSAQTGLSTHQLSYTARPWQLRHGNDIEVLRGGAEVYDTMIAAIEQAQKTVCMETYILSSDRSGKRFSAALRDRAKAGVTVRLLYDAIGSLGIDDSYLEELARDGVEIVEYHPVAPWKKRFNIGRRDHRKILVVDGEVGFAGGFNISDTYLSPEEGGEGWFDVHCKVRGPLVRDLASLFRSVWVSEGGKPYPIEDVIGPHASADSAGTSDKAKIAPGKSVARIVDNQLRRRRRRIRRAYLRAINQAYQSICIMNAYFLPDRGIRRALLRAHKRGARVRVIVPENSDLNAIEYAGKHMYGALIGKGIEILWWPKHMMHAKTAVIDGLWASVGSYNLDSRSLSYNLEVMVEVIDPELGRHLEERFNEAAERCKPFTLEAWKTRPFTDKVLSWFFYQFRRWL